MATQQETDDLAHLLLSASDAEQATAEVHEAAIDASPNQESALPSNTASGDTPLRQSELKQLLTLQSPC